MELEERIRYAKRALDGIALGDCFGETFFVSDEIARQRVKNREILNESWHFTDDTVMAIGIYRVLEKYGKIDQDELAKVFAENYALDWHRGYGGTAHSILRSIGEGKDWREVASGVFDGMGSILERERLFCAMSQINCRKVIPNIKYCLRLPLKRRAA